MGSSYTDHDYHLLFLATSWPAMTATVLLVLLGSGLFLLALARDWTGWKDYLALTVFLTTAVGGLIHLTFSLFIRGYGH